MRFLLTFVIWMVFVGGLWAYTSQRDASLPQGPAQVAAPKTVTRAYVLEITPSFSIEKDPFALDLGDDSAQSSGLEVRLNGQALTVDAGQIQRGQKIQVRTGLNLIEGFNEFYVKASPPMAENHLDHGLRVQLLDQGVPVVDQTLWSSSGAVVAGAVSFALTPSREDEHDH